MYISDLLTADCIELAADVKTKDEVIARLAELLEKNGIEFRQTTDLEEALPELDILYMTRIQRERFDSAEKYEELNNKKLRLESILQRIKTIKAMEEQFEGYNNSVRFVMNSYAQGKITDRFGAPCGKIYGPLSKVISVDSKYVTAVETALGLNLQNIVVEDEETAKSAMFALKRGEAGRATFFPLTSSYSLLRQLSM